MTFLELCRRLRQEAQIAGVGPSTVTNQTGENQSLVSWIQAAWNDIQLMRPNWMWMNKNFSFNSVVGQTAYSPASVGLTDFSSWDLRSVSVSRDINGSVQRFWLEPVSLDVYRKAHLPGGAQAQPSTPRQCSVGNARELLLGPTPDAVYAVSGIYRKRPQVLVNNGDVPEMPEEYHLLIVYRALIKYARAEAAGEIYADALAEAKQHLRRLELNQLPTMAIADPLI